LRGAPLAAIIKQFVTFGSPKDYRPEPVETSGIALDARIEPLIELLARNVHDVWAQERLAQGWTYGPARDDSKKQHPCLVPYEQLPESEKQYDRHVAVGTLKAITAFGYRLTRNGDD
jgi:RyR domain-containing protein